jgi:hypothetical protein
MQPSWPFAGGIGLTLELTLDFKSLLRRAAALRYRHREVRRMIQE